MRVSTAGKPAASASSDWYFIEKRPWSRVKDGILSYYLEPYLNKIKKLKRRILIVDTFAGPGLFERGSEPGSPLIITESAERAVPGNYDAVFTNIEEDQHELLQQRLEPYPNASAHLMRARRILQKLNQRIKDQSLFLYLDPYGIDECDYDLVKPLLDRTLHEFSTKLMIVFQMPQLHRQAARENVLEAYGSLDPSTRTWEEAIALVTPEFRNKIANSDLFHRDVPADFIQSVFTVMGQTSHHTFQILTKRPDRMAEVVPSLRLPDGRLFKEEPLPNVWLGTSVEDQKAADERIPHLLQTPARVRFLSCEPLLDALDLGEYFSPFITGYAHIHWVIVGGESGWNARRMEADWVRSIRAQCEYFGVDFFFKQWGGVNKKKEGRELDGRTYDDMPMRLAASAA